MCVISNLTSNDTTNSTNQECIRECGWIDQLIMLLSYSDDAVRDSCVCVRYQILQVMINNAHIISERGGVAKLIDLLSDNTTEVRYVACCALCIM